MNEGDILDYVRENANIGNGLTEISRVELLHIGGFNNSSSNLTVILRRFPKLIIAKEDLD